MIADTKIMGAITTQMVRIRRQYDSACQAGNVTLMEHHHQLLLKLHRDYLQVRDGCRNKHIEERVMNIRSRKLSVVPIYSAWLPSEIQFLRDNYRVMTYEEMSKVLNRSRDSVRHKTKCLGMRRTTEEILALHRRTSCHTMFKKGQTSINTLFDGAETVRTRIRSKKKHLRETRVFVRVAPMKWIEKQILLWTQKYGPVPKGMILWCKDKNPLNCDPENWELITRQESIHRTRQTDQYIANAIAGRNSQLASAILEESPELIELKRHQLKLKQILKNESTGTTQ